MNPAGSVAMMKEEKELRRLILNRNAISPHCEPAGDIKNAITALIRAVREDERSKHICPCDICRGEAAIRRKK